MTMIQRLSNISTKQELPSSGDVNTDWLYISLQIFSKITNQILITNSVNKY